jgi:hypothetical protein
VDEDGTSGGSQQWHTRGGADSMAFHSPNLAVLGDDVRKRGCVEVVVFFPLLIVSLSALVSFWLRIFFVDIEAGLMNPLSKKCSYYV